MIAPDHTFAVRAHPTLLLARAFRSAPPSGAAPSLAPESTLSRARTLDVVRKLLNALAAIGGVAISTSASAEQPLVFTLKFSTIAVEGYDTVSYFSTGGPIKGSPRFEAKYLGATWRFASASNKKAFVAAPKRFAPQYGGYCAWAVSQGYTAKGDPRSWTLVGGKLYLNYNEEIQRRWEKNRDYLIEAADSNWPGVLSK